MSLSLFSTLVRVAARIQSNLQVNFKLDLVNLLMEMLVLVLLDINVTKAHIDEG